ncbi:MAG: hypothetical protein ACREDV_03050 [Methylocella sp.]
MAIYYTLPTAGMKPDFYGITLWILSGCVLVASAIILVVVLIAPQTIHPKWLDTYLSPPHYSGLRN